LNDYSSMESESLLKNPDGRAVVVAASQVPIAHDNHPSFSANLKILNPLLQASPDYICYISSDAVYPFDKKVTEATKVRPTTSYARMHLMREQALIDRFQRKLLIVRLPQVYGAGDRHNAYGPMRMYVQP
jgi:UDP-glucose 4-epimerase